MRLFKQHYGVKGLFKPLTFAVLTVSIGLALSFLVLHTYQGFAGTRESKTHSTGGRDGNSVFFLNDRARAITGAAAVGAPGFIVPEGLTGEGQIVAVADSGLDTGRLEDIHPDLQSVPGKMPKVVMLKSWTGRENPDDPDGHGTHMAATIAGTGAASGGQFKGVAPGASIYFQAILDADGKPAPPANLADLFWPAYAAGARVHVDGWGGGSNTYGEVSAQVDDFMRENPDFLIVFGAGNSGPFSGTITSEANSKNALVVGASELPRPAFVPSSDDSASIAEFSSRGPAGDGRIKPELLAPASAVVSARSSLIDGNMPGYPEYTRMQGTSMAAAIAGGSTALLREYLKKESGMQVISAAFLKATLINGARPLPGGPSKDGYGIIDIAGTIIALKEGTFRTADEWAGLAHGAELSYTFQVTDTTAPFKATLVWTDPPAAAGSPQTLVNDLDLIVQTPDGRVYYGNHFLGPNSPDRKNNVEQVYLPSPVAGEYTVRVVGSAVKRNTVSGSPKALQDFALVWGQVPARGVVSKVNNGMVSLEQGGSFNLSDLPVVNLIDDQVTVFDEAHLFPGASVYRTPKKVYFTIRLWRETAARVIRSAEGFIFTENNPALRTGGYSLANDQEVLVNGKTGTPAGLPPGVEVLAVVNPFDQKVRQVRVSYVEREGVVAAVRVENGEKKLWLEGSGYPYTIAPDAVYSFDDSYLDSRREDLPFGAGAMAGLAEVLPGMPVHIRIAPSSGLVEYLAVKRWVVLGTVSEITAAGKEVHLQGGAAYRLLPGAPVEKDGADATLGAVSPGDHVVLIVLPDSGEAIKLVAYSNVEYGKAVDFTRKNRTFYYLGDDGSYHAVKLPGEAIVYRWGSAAGEEAIAPGSRVRVTLDPAGEEVSRLDIAETFFSEDVFSGYDAAGRILAAGEGRIYLAADTTRYSKNGFPVQPEDLRAGERVKVEYATAAGGDILVSVNALVAVPAPELTVSILSLPGKQVLTGRTGADCKVYLWDKNGLNESIDVDLSGRFRLSLPGGNEQGYSLTLVAVDRRTGGVAGRTVTLPGGTRNNGIAEIVAAVTGLDAGTEPDAVALTRAQIAEVLSRFFSWPRSGGQALAFKDAGDIPPSYRAAVTEASLRGIFRGYPEGYFLPGRGLTRAEAAVVLAAVIRDLGLQLPQPAALHYPDSGNIPAWALQAAGELTVAGILAGRTDGTFCPDELFTACDLTAALTGLQNYCLKQLTS